MRLFVGLSLPPQLCDQLMGLCTGLGDVRWVKRENLHLTLRFIGEVEAKDGEDIDSVLSALKGESFDLTLKGLGSFSSARRVHSVWVGAAPSEGLNRLAAKVDHALVSCGLLARKRKFLPHVTLARAKKIAPHRLETFYAEHGQFESAPFTVSRFTLYRSHLLADGAVYESLEEYPLSRTPLGGNVRAIEKLAESENV